MERTSLNRSADDHREHVEALDAVQRVYKEMLHFEEERSRIGAEVLDKIRKNGHEFLRALLAGEFPEPAKREGKARFEAALQQGEAEILQAMGGVANHVTKLFKRDKAKAQALFDTREGVAMSAAFQNHHKLLKQQEAEDAKITKLLSKKSIEAERLLDALTFDSPSSSFEDEINKLVGRLNYGNLDIHERLQDLEKIKMDLTKVEADPNQLTLFASSRTRIAAVIDRAGTLSRRIYASLPFEERLAHFFAKFALDTVETMGKALGAEFLIRGVTGMPDPGAFWDPDSRNPSLTLPRNYLKEFASSAYGQLMKKFHDPELVEEAVQNYLLKIMTHEHIKPMPLPAAEKYVRNGLINSALDIIRHRRRKDSPPGTMSLDEDYSGKADVSTRKRLMEEVLEDPRALHQMEQELGSRAWKRYMDWLSRRIHVDIPEYIGFSMHGWSDVDIIGDPRVPGKPGMLTHYHPPPSGPNAYLKLIKRIPEETAKFFRSIGEEIPVSV